MPQRVSPRLRFAILLAATCAGAGAGALAQPFRPQVPTAAPVVEGTLALDVTVLDRDGKPVDTIVPDDVSVTVDGQPRRVVWVRRVSRGPGAVADAAARSLRAAAPGMTLAAEPVRTVLVVVDAASVVRRYEREAITAASLVLDRLGIGDQVAVLSIPLRRDQLMTFSSDQPTIREAVAGILGQASRRTATTEAASPFDKPERIAGVNPDRERSVEPERPAREDVAMLTGERSRLPGDLEAEPAAGRDSASSLNQLMLALTKVPGRKTVILLSAGLPDSASPLVVQAAERAARGRTVVHTFKLRDDPGAQPEPLNAGLLDRLARATGGAYVALGGKPESQVDRLVSELAATVVVGLERVDGDAPARVKAVRLATRRRDITLRGPLAWSIDQPADNDVLPPPPAQAPASGTSALRYDTGGRVAVVPADAGPASNNPEFLRAFGRLTEYVDSYVEKSSALVAEEDYRQTYGRMKVHLLSDVLIVKPGQSLQWVSFRDVFAVDGSPVREREDRLKRLFLEAKPEAEAQLEAIKAESSRYNIGPVERNINVPYFPLKFLSASNRGRFRYELKGTSSVSGVKSWRIEFKELVRPTIVRDRADRDVPSSGWFLVDQATGAVVQTGLSLEGPGHKVSIVVKYARNSQLGLWVPDEMAETYRIIPKRERVGLDAEMEVRGTARYTKFRRFQVNTETTLTIPK